MSFVMFMLDCLKIGDTLWEWQNDLANLYHEIWNMCMEIRWTGWAVKENNSGFLSNLVSLWFYYCCRVLMSVTDKKVEPKYKCVVVQGLFLLDLLFMTTAVYWYNYERFKKMMCKSAGAREPTFLIAFTAGAASGCVSTHFCFYCYSYYRH